MNDMCQECLDEHRAYLKSPERPNIARVFVSGARTRPTIFAHRRDFEEGMTGRIYRVCGACVTKENERLADEVDEFGDDYWDDDDDDFGTRRITSERHRSSRTTRHRVRRLGMVLPRDHGPPLALGRSREEERFGAKMIRHRCAEPGRPGQRAGRRTITAGPRSSRIR